VKQIERIDKLILKARADVAEAEGFRAKLVAELADAKPADVPKKHEELQSIDTEIAGAQSKLRHLLDARQLAEQRDLKAYRAQDEAQLQALRALVDELSAAMSEDFRALVATLESLQPIVARIEARGNDRASAAFSIMRTCAPDHVDRLFSPISSVLRGDVPALRGIVADTLFATSFGRAGLHLQPFVEVQPARVDVTLDHVLAKTEQSIGSALDNAMNKYAAKVQA